jgi:hypothetical protein
MHLQHVLAAIIAIALVTRQQRTEALLPTAMRRHKRCRCRRSRAHPSFGPAVAANIAML